MVEINNDNKINGEKQYILVNEEGDAFCLGCRTIAPKKDLYYNRASDSYYHKDCIPVEGHIVGHNKPNEKKDNLIYGCDNCKRLFNYVQVQPNPPDQEKGLACPACKALVSELETRTVKNKARLLYLGMCIVLVILAFVFALFFHNDVIPMPSHSENGFVGFVGIVMMAIIFLGLISFMVLCGYALHAEGYGFGGGPGWRLTKQELINAPVWYQKPTLGAELIREAAISIVILVIALVWYLVMKLIKG